LSNTNGSDNGYVNFEGVAFWFKKQYIIIPPLPLRVVQQYDMKIRALGSRPHSIDLPQVNAIATGETTAPQLTEQQQEEQRAWDDKSRELTEQIILRAIRRNYSTEAFSDDELLDFITYETFYQASRAAQGLAEKSTPRYRSVGEIRPVGQSQGLWIGATSTGGPLPDLQ
jgi:hypothetical protein